MARIGIIGSEGRMGHALARAIVDAGHELVGGVDQGGNTANLAEASDVLVDFTAPAALEGDVAGAAATPAPSLALPLLYPPRLTAELALALRLERAKSSAVEAAE